MPPLQDLYDIRRAIVSQAQGTLDEYANNPDLLEQRRRESLNNVTEPEDTEPRYTTANMEAIESIGLSSDILVREESVYQQYESFLQRDITLQNVLDYEEGSDDSKIHCAYLGRPAARYNTEKGLEMIRIASFQEKDERCSEGTREWLAAMNESKRKALVRHFIRHRWKNLKVWGDDWKLKPSPNALWEWPWGPSAQDSRGILNLTHDAINECGVMRPGCYGKLMRTKVKNRMRRRDWDVMRGDDFIGSRPWFVFEVECMVEETRRWTLPAEAKRSLPTEASDFIRRKWIEKGIWSKVWSFRGREQKEAIVGWRWAGEPREPQRADLTYLNRRGRVDFTQSEEEELERVVKNESEEDEVPDTEPGEGGTSGGQENRQANNGNGEGSSRSAGVKKETNDDSNGNGEGSSRSAGVKKETNDDSNGNGEGSSRSAGVKKETNDDSDENITPCLRRSARIAERQRRRRAATEAGQAVQESASIPQASAQGQGEVRRHLLTRSRPEKRGRGSEAVTIKKEDNEVAEDSEGRARKRRRQG